MASSLSKSEKGVQVNDNALFDIISVAGMPLGVSKKIDAQISKFFANPNNIHSVPKPILVAYDGLHQISISASAIWNRKSVMGEMYSDATTVDKPNTAKWVLWRTLIKNQEKEDSFIDFVSDCIRRTTPFESITAKSIKRMDGALIFDIGFNNGGVFIPASELGKDAIFPMIVANIAMKGLMLNDGLEDASKFFGCVSIVNSVNIDSHALKSLFPKIEFSFS